MTVKEDTLTASDVLELSLMNEYLAHDPMKPPARRRGEHPWLDILANADSLANFVSRGVRRS